MCLDTRSVVQKFTNRNLLLPGELIIRNIPSFQILIDVRIQIYFALFRKLEYSKGRNGF
jgi:hypothetical protein